MNEYLYERMRKLMRPTCTFCGKRPENIMHFFGNNSCTNYTMIKIKNSLRRAGMDCITREYVNNKAKWIRKQWNIEEFDPDNINTYVFPDHRLDIYTRTHLIQSLVNATRMILRERRRWSSCDMVGGPGAYLCRGYIPRRI